jgi:hypothetical protein
MKITDPRTLAHAGVVVGDPIVLFTQWPTLSAVPQVEHSKQSFRADVLTTGNQHTLAI